MSVQAIPTPDGTTPFSSQTTVLDGVPYILVFRYSQREDRWYLQLQTIDGTPIYGGVKLVPNWPLFAQCVSSTRPPGQFILISNNKSDLTPPGLNEIAPGARCVLCYVPIADVTAILAGTGT